MPVLNVGARLQNFSQVWESIDSWSHSVVKNGYNIQLWKNPKTLTNKKHFNVSMTKTEQAAIDQHVLELIDDGAVEQVTDQRDLMFGVVSSLFCVKKKGTRELRPCLNLKKFNDYTVYKKFKMEGLSSVREIIRPNDFLTKVDLKKAYHHIPVHTHARKYLQFIWHDTTYQFKCLPFGLQSAPRIFTKVLRPLLGILRSKGIRLVAYLDDILILSRSRKRAVRDNKIVVDLLEEFGFLINKKKSVFSPTKKLEFLGTMVNTKRFSLQVPKKKLRKFLREARQIHNKTNHHKSITLRKLAGIIGKLNSMAQAMEGIELHIRGLQWALAQNTANHPTTHVPWDKHVHLHQHIHAVQDLEWWSTKAPLWNGRTLMQRQAPDKIIYTDASDIGYAGVLQTKRHLQVVTRGLWSRQEVEDLSINSRELLAISRTILGLIKHKKWKNKTILVYTDSMVSKWVLNKHTAKTPDMMRILRLLLITCRRHNIIIEANHIPGKENVVADKHSRRDKDSSDWRLNPAIFHILDSVWGPHTVDWTASRLNTQLPRFCSWMFDPEATYVDVLRSLHPRANGYSNPPFSLIGRILQLVRIRKVTLTLVAPVWRSQPWWPVLMSMCVEYPLLLSDPSSLEDLYYQHIPFSQYHRHHFHPQTHHFLFVPPDHRSGMKISPPKWEVGAFRISGNSALCKSFEQRRKWDSWS